MSATLVSPQVVQAKQRDPFDLTGVIGTFMGRDALALAASYLALGSGDTVLLPAYNCKEVVRPFAQRTNVALYDVQPDLTIDPDEIRARLRATGARVMVLINYFGFLQPHRAELKKICTDSGVALIEDCAHSLLTDESGETGDLAVYSFRKLLPLPDGGGLRINLEGRQASAKFHPALYSNVLSVLSSAKSLLKVRSDTLSRAGFADGKETFRSSNTLRREDTRTLPLSWFARRGLANANCADVIEKKRADFGYWQGICKGDRRMHQVFDNLPEGVCPIGYPIRIRNRESIVTQARAEGVQLRVHWRLSPSLQAECGNSYKLSTETLTLPVFPELGRREREVVTRLISAA